MNFLIMNRSEIQKYKLQKYHIIISISDPYSGTPQLPKNKFRKDVIYLTFHDWDDYQKEKIEKSNNKDMIFFNENDAKTIVKFVRKYKNKINTIICQCEGGISRSAGVAGALAKCINGYDFEIFNKYIPNRRVYRLVMNAWYIV